MSGRSANETSWLHASRRLLCRVTGSILLAVLSSPAFATTYTFTSPNYTSATDFTAPCTAGNCQNYTTAMHVAGFFTTAAPLAANLVNADVRAQVTSFSFSDGINTFVNTDPKVRLIALSLSTNVSGVPVGSNTFIVLQQWESGSGPHTGAGLDRFNEVFVDPNADDFNTRGCNTVGTDSGVADSCLGPVPFDPNMSEASNSVAGTWTVTGGGGPSATTTSVVSSSNPSTFGQSVAFTATVTGSSPTGTVQFKDAANNLGSAVALSGTSAQLTTSSLSAGTHSITAVYSGDPNNQPSTSSPIAQVVNGAAPPPPSSPAQPIPTLSQWAIIVLSVLLGAFGIVLKRRRR